MTEREKREYFARRMSGKGAAARAADRILFLLLLFLVWLLVWYAHPLRMLLACMAAAASAVVLAWVWRVRYRAFVRRETTRIRRMLFTHALLTLPRQKLLGYLEEQTGAPGFVVCQIGPVTVDAFLREWREAPDKACCYLTAELTAEAAELIGQRLPNLTVYDRDRVYRLLKEKLPVGDGEVDAYIAARLAARKRKRLRTPRLPSGLPAAGKYLAVGTLLLALSVVTRFALYYRLLASGAFLASALTGVPQLLKQARQKEAPP